MQPLFSCKPSEALGRWAVGVSVAVVGAFSAPVAAQAQPLAGGSWQALLEVVASGTVTKQVGSEMKTSTYTDKYNSPAPTEPWQSWSLRDYHSASGFGAQAYNGQTASLSAGQWQYYIHLRWLPNDPNNPAPAPSQGAVLFDSRVDMVSSATGASNLQVSGASGSAPVAAADIPFSYNGYQYTIKQLASEGKRLISFATPQGQTQFHLGPFTSTLSGSVTSPSVGGQFPEATVESHNSASVRIDDRTVKLSRTDATNEWHTNENGVPVTHGDTIYSFTEHQAGQTPEWVPVPQKFASALSGNWSRGLFLNSGGYNITWNWVDGGLEEYHNLNPLATSRQNAAESYTRWNGMSRVSPKGELEPYYGFLGNTPPTYTDEGNPAQNNTKRGGRPPTAVTVKYFARDNADNAQAEARYKLTIHEPIELVGGKQLVKAYNVTSPAYYTDPNDGKWKLVSSLIGDADHIYTPGSWAYTISHGAAKAQGYTVGFEGGPGGAGFNFVIGYNHSAEMSWSKEIGGTATLQETIGIGESAYLEVVFPRQVLKQEYRLYNESGELRSSQSPPVPSASIPYSKRWEESVSGPTTWWHKLKPGEMLPPNESELPVAQGNSGGSS